MVIKNAEGGMKDVTQVSGISKWVDSVALNWNNDWGRWWAFYFFCKTCWLYSSSEISSGVFERIGVLRAKSQNRGQGYRNTVENYWLRAGKWSCCFSTYHLGGGRVQSETHKVLAYSPEELTSVWERLELFLFWVKSRILSIVQCWFAW